MVTGVILAGGSNRRMGGRPKALIRLQDEPMYVRQCRLMRPLCTEILLVTNEPQLYIGHNEKELRLIPDRNPGAGPLAGLEAAGLEASGPLLWVVGCDMPFLSAEAAALLRRKLEERERTEAVIPCLDGKLQPLHGLYRKSVGEQAARLLRSDQRRVMGLFEHLTWEALHNEAFEAAGITTDFTLNANTPEAWAGVLGIVE